MITAAQLRAARGLLDWSRSELSKASKVSQETIKNIEHGVFRPQETTEEAIVKAFAAHDVTFLENDGVQKKKEFIRTYVGNEEFKMFFDDMYKVAKEKNSDICIFGVEDKMFIKHLGDYSDVHIRRMGQLTGNKVRCIIREGDEDLYCESYNEYRSVPADKFSSVPFYIYEDRFAVIIFDNNKVTVVSILSRPVAEAYRKQFDIIWGRATQIKTKAKKGFSGT